MRIQHVPVTDGTRLAVAIGGDAPAAATVLQLSGGPGCVNYLAGVVADPASVPDARVVSPDPRGVGGSGGGPHDTAQALADLEDLRRALGVESWSVAGHSYGADLALAYALEHPNAVRRVVAACGTGVQNDRDWSATYHARRDSVFTAEVEYEPAVHHSLLTDWRRWIKAPDLLARLGSLPVPVTFVLAEQDVRPSWPVEQLAQLVPGAVLDVAAGVGHDFWYTHPEAWKAYLTKVAGA